MLVFSKCLGVASLLYLNIALPLPSIFMENRPETRFPWWRSVRQHWSVPYYAFSLPGNTFRLVEGFASQILPRFWWYCQTLEIDGIEIHHKRAHQLVPQEENYSYNLLIRCRNKQYLPLVHLANKPFLVEWVVSTRSYKDFSVRRQKSYIPFLSAIFAVEYSQIPLKAARF